MGLPGVWTWDFGESFGLHYLDSIAMNHNAIGRGYETFGNATAETVTRSLGRGGWEDEALGREWFRPLPPPAGDFAWSMRDNVNYQQTGALAILDWTARHAKEVLRNFYRTGFNSWRKGANEKPRAFVVPAGQTDPLRVADMVNRLLDQRIEVGRLTAPLSVDEGTFPSGSYVVLLEQPYRNYAVDLLEPQRFAPEADRLPYDDVSWALPVGFGVQVVRVDDDRATAASMEAVTRAAAPAGRIGGGTGSCYVLRDTGREALLAARFRLSRHVVRIAESPFQAGGIEHPAGSWILPRQEGLREALEDVASELGLDFTALPEVPAVRAHDAPAPRIGVWVP